jgi:predicted DNA-binding transcriptional regulator AlpA
MMKHIETVKLTPELRKIVTAMVRELLATQLIKPEEIVRKKDLSVYTGLGRSQNDVLIETGQLPPGIPLNDSGRALGWFKSTLVEYQQTLKKCAEDRLIRRSKVSARIEEAAAEGRCNKRAAARSRSAEIKS